MRTSSAAPSTRLAALALLGTATVASAQLAGLGDLSSSCQSAAAGLITGDFATCINALGLVSVLSASGSVVAPLNSWLSGACAQTCSAATLSSAGQAVQSGCSADIANGSALAVGLETIVSNYTDVKQVLCLQATSNSTFCLTNLLGGVQNATGTSISVSTVTGLLTNPAGFGSFLGNVPASTLCTDCTHGLVTELTPLLSAVASNVTSAGTANSTTTSALSAVSNECGASFVDGQLPASVQQASNSSSSATSGGSSTASASGSGATGSMGGGSGAGSTGGAGTLGLTGGRAALAALVVLGGAVALL